MRDQHAHPPDVLWHYTNAAGLFGILTKDCLHFTDARFLNDTSEIEYGRELCREVINETVSANGGGNASLVRNLLKHFAGPTQTAWYVACFCKDGNLLSQWRTYGATGNGFSIGFDTRSTTWREFNTGGGALLRRVEYDQNEQRRRIINALRCGVDLVKEVEKYDDGDEESLVQAAAMVADQLMRFLPSEYLTFKNQAFSEEREWRLIATRVDPASQDLDFRIAGHSLTPYISLGGRLRVSQHGDHLPIQEIKCGPGVPREVSEISLPQLLAKMGRGSIKISRAVIPIRS